jgi:phytoene dehydrogenase-like protein
MTDVLVIGGGHNGLVAATMLAKAGRKVVVLERSDRPGGCARTSEIAPGFRCPALAHTASLDPAIVRELALDRHGLTIVRPDADACAPGLDGRGLVLWRDAARAAREIQAFSAKDAEQYPRFLESFRKISGVLQAIASAPPPSIDDPGAGDVIEALKSARRFRALGKADAYRLLRWMPMAVADLAGEWFESEPLKATVAAGGILGSFLGPWSAGSGALLLMLGAGEGHPIASGWFARGGVGAVGDALASAARAAGVEIRANAGVARILVRDAAATGVSLESGEEISARIVASSADPKRTLLGLIDPIELAPDFIRRVSNIRANGTLAKINVAVDHLPRFAGLSGRNAGEQAAALSGRIRLAKDVDAIERAFDAAKYGGFSSEPWIELTIPSLLDPSLAPAGKHVVSAYVQYAPYRLRDTNWDAERDRLGDTAVATIARYAPDFPASIAAREVITPLDLERSYGLTGGHVFHGELALDQLFVARPMLGWASYATPIRNLYLCGSGTHPGTGLSGRSGALAARAILKA